MQHDLEREIAEPASAETVEGLSLGDYWNILIKRLWLVILVLVIVVTGVALYTVRQPKVYEATTTVIIDPEGGSVLHEIEDSTQGGTSWYLQGQIFETQIRIIQSRKVAERVVRELGLAENLEFLGLAHIQDEAQLARALEASDPAGRVLAMLSVDPVKDTRMLRVKVRHQDPEITAMVANGIADAYRDQNIERRLEAMRDAFRWLEKQYERYESRLQESRDALNRFKEAAPLLFTNPTQQQTLTSDRLSQLHALLISVEDERIKTGYMLEQLESFEIDYLNAGSISTIVGSDTLSNLASRYIALREQEEMLKERYLDDHPELRTVRRQLALVEQAIKSEIETSRDLYRSQHAAKLRAERDLQSRIQQVEREASQLEELKLLYEQVESQKAEQQRLFELVQRRMNEVNLAQLLEINNVRILDRAQQPSAPIQPRPMFNMLLALAAGLVVGVGLAFALEFLDNTIKTQEDVERFLPFLGVLPVIHKKDRTRLSGTPPDGLDYSFDLHVAFHPRSSVAECMRTIRTNILFMSPGKQHKVIMVTSPNPLEGKTTNAISLATVMAQSSSRVLLLDLDMRRPRLHRAFEQHGGVGIADICIGQSTIDEAVRPTGVPNLDLLPCGTIPPNPSELLHTKVFRDLLDRLAERYDRIIIDSPPVIPVTDAMVIAQHVDGLVLVCRSGSTRRELLKRTTQLLRGINAPIIGTILNNVNLRNRRQGSYYYHYYRHYGQYYADDVADEQERI